MSRWLSISLIVIAGCGNLIPEKTGETVDVAPTQQDDEPEATSPPTTTVSGTVEPSVFILTVDIVGLGTVDPLGGPHAEGVLSLTAVPGPGWRFDHWEGALRGVSANETLLLDEDLSVTALFFREIVLVSLQVQSIGDGSVLVSPLGTPSAGGWTYPELTEVTLTAVPDAGFVFNHWAGIAASVAPVVTLSLEQDTFVTATFSPPPFVPGNVFSFLTVPETEAFLLRVGAANDEISRWRQAELAYIAITNIGRASNSSIVIQLVCEADEQATRMRREATWSILENDLGMPYFSLILLGAIDEVNSWNCRKYPDPPCSAFFTCRG